MKRLSVSVLFIMMTYIVSAADNRPDTTRPGKASASAAHPGLQARSRFIDPQVGDMAPDFVLNDLQGRPVKLSVFRGKYVLLDFWRSSCAPCRREHPHLIALYLQYRSKGFEILSVSTDYADLKGEAAWKAAVAKDKLTWTQVWDPQMLRGPGSKASVSLTKYSVAGLPRNFLIDPQGRIIARDLKGDPLTQQLKAVLDKS